MEVPPKEHENQQKLKPGRTAQRETLDSLLEVAKRDKFWTAQFEAQLVQVWREKNYVAALDLYQRQLDQVKQGKVNSGNDSQNEEESFLLHTSAGDVSTWTTVSNTSKRCPQALTMLHPFKGTTAHQFLNWCTEFAKAFDEAFQDSTPYGETRCINKLRYYLSSPLIEIYEGLVDNLTTAEAWTWKALTTEIANKLLKSKSRPAAYAALRKPFLWKEDYTHHCTNFNANFEVCVTIPREVFTEHIVVKESNPLQQQRARCEESVQLLFQLAFLRTLPLSVAERLHDSIGEITGMELQQRAGEYLQREKYKIASKERTPKQLPR